MNREICVIDVEPRQLQALLQLVRRAPMSDGEVCFTEDLFNNWFAAVQEQQRQFAALRAVTNLASTAGRDGAGDVLSGEPLGATLPDGA